MASNSSSQTRTCTNGAIREKRGARILIADTLYRAAALDDVEDGVVAQRGEGHPAFDSKNLGAGQSWRFVMQKKGHFNYACAYHPSMLGVLMVQ